MTLFSVIYCRRSDGKLEIVTKSKGREKNEPTKEQLDAKPDAKGVSDYYRLLGLQDSKHLDWRRKLAGMLARELGSSDYSPGVCFVGHQDAKCDGGSFCANHACTRESIYSRRSTRKLSPV
jgi:hypothetical protein